MSYIILTALAIIFVFSILMQFRFTRFKRLCVFLDHAAILPIASVFAPTPPTFDVEILYRDKLLDGSATIWRRVSVNRPPFWQAIFWCPSKRWRKEQTSMATGLLRQINRELRSESSTDRIYHSYIFVTFANYVTQQLHSPMSEYTQFIIILTSGFEEKQPAILFISPYYRL